MKKRVKLITTIASLCLAVALMAFGVYAATNSKVTLTSTIKYSVSGQVNMEMKVQVAYTAGHVTVTGNDAYDSGAENTWTITQLPGQENVNKTINLGSYEFNSASIQNDTITYTITITNRSATEDLYIKVSGINETTSGAVTSKINAPTESKAAKNNGTYVYTVVYTLADATQSLDKDLSFNPMFEMQLVDFGA